MLGALSIAFAAAAIAVAASGGDTPVRAAEGKPSRSVIERGRTVFARLACADCHQLDGSGAGGEFEGGIGPNLSQAGLMETKTRERLRQDIVDPLAEPKAPEGSSGEFGTMPTDFAQRMKPGELEALITYLLSTRRQ